MDSWIIEAKRSRLLRRKEVVYKKRVPESELNDEIKAAIRFGADNIKLEKV